MQYLLHLPLSLMPGLWKWWSLCRDDDGRCQDRILIAACCLSLCRSFWRDVPTARFFVGGPLAEGSSAAGSRAHLCSDIAAVRHELWPYTCYNWPEIVRRLDVISTSDEWNMLILYQLNTLVIHLTNLRLDSFPSHIFLVALLVVFNISVLIHRKSR